MSFVLSFFKKYQFLCLQNLKNQVMTTNVWVEQVFINNIKYAPKANLYIPAYRYSDHRRVVVIPPSDAEHTAVKQMNI